jgi:hypothetical protein
MPIFLAKEQRIFVLKQWWISGRALRTVNAAFRHEFPDEEISSRQTIYRIESSMYHKSLFEEEYGQMVSSNHFSLKVMLHQKLP